MRTATLSLLLTVSFVAPLAVNEARGDDRAVKADGPPAASKSEEASQRFKSGVAFYKDRDFAAARVEFERAYELVPNYNVLFNLGQTARELKDYAAALKAFERYLREGGPKLGAARRKDVQASIDELRKKVGTLRITTNVDGAEILVDDVAVGVSPLADPVLANVGRRKLSATSSGYPPVQRMVDVPGAAETAVTLELTKIAPPEPPPPEPPPKVAPPKPPIPLTVWATLTATGASAVVTAVMGGLAVSAHGGLEGALAAFPGDPKAIADAQSRTRTFAVTTDVLLGVTAAGAAATVILFVLAPRRADEAKSVTVGVSPAGLVVRGGF